MLPVRSILVDFDGTACLHDVAEHLMDRFGDPSWRDFDVAWANGEMNTPDSARAQVAPFAHLDGELVAYALEHCPIDPTFPPFVRWARDRGVDVTIVSDGLGLYVRPLLEKAGVSGVPVITNDWNGGQLAFPNGHPECDWCGTCKMLAVQRAPGPVAFVGEGLSDRYGALYADLVFAKDDLVAPAQADGVPFLPYVDFDDVRRAIEEATTLPGPVDPSRCPGWHPR
jgi:2-hydroxy-3-keto-5-methylthiopentenyl-1-phosphate phosphatase